MAFFEARHLHKRFGARVVLEDISLSFAEGAVSGIMGPNGAGKTTCFHVLTGLYRPDRGEILLEGRPITGLPPQRIARLGVSRSFQIMNLFDAAAVIENVMLALPEFRARRLDFFGGVFDRPDLVEPALEVLEQVGLAHRAWETATSLSYGERRGLEIGVALAARPKLLFLDEPTSGLGSEATRNLAALVRRLGERYTIVMIEHDMRFLFDLAERIAVIHWGQVIAEGTPAELQADKWVRRSALAEVAMLEVRGIEAFYGETQALFGASLAVGTAEIVALLGPNGAGKTTTIRAILGLTRARAGSIRFDGSDITGWPTHRISALGISWVPDDRRVFPTLTVARNLKIAQRRTRFRAWRLGEMFAIFSALEHLLARECENLSGGEMQMVAISRALLASPGLVLFDEPSQGLAPRIVQNVFETVRLLKAEGIASLVVEQNALAALEVADRVYVMDQGRIVYEGQAAELRDDAPLRRRLIGV